MTKVFLEMDNNKNRLDETLEICNYAEIKGLSRSCLSTV